MPPNLEPLNNKKMKNYILIPSDMRNQDEVLDLLMSEGPSGYGVFIMVCEFLRECESYRTRDDAKRLNYALRAGDESLVDRVLHNYNLFRVSEDGMIECPVFTASMEGYDRKREANKRAAAARWEKRAAAENPNAHAMQMHENESANAVQRQNSGSPNSINRMVEKSTNQPSTVDFGGGCVVERALLDKVCREKSCGASEQLLQQMSDRKDADHNGDAVATVSRAFSLSEAQTKLLWRITNGGEIGNPNLEDALTAMRSARTMSATVKYPFNYILSKLRTYDK